MLWSPRSHGLGTHTHTHTHIQWCLCKWGLCEYDLYGSPLWCPWEQMSLAFFQLSLSLSLSLCSECKVNTRWRDSVLCSNSNCSSQWTLTCDMRGWFSSPFSFSLFFPITKKTKYFFLNLFPSTVKAHSSLSLRLVFGGLFLAGSRVRRVYHFIKCFSAQRRIWEKSSGLEWQGHNLW